MFPDSFSINALIFVLGQIAACGYLRTGLAARGLWLLVGTWVAADVALVARFAYGHQGAVYIVALVLMQLASVVAFVLFVSGRVRRRMPRGIERRQQLRKLGFVAYLRGDLGAARQHYEALLRSDPWDAASRLALGTVLLREGQVGRGRRLLRGVGGLDAMSEYRHAVERELARMAPPRAVRTAAQDPQQVA